jgi:hypothetical protein
MNTGAKIAHFGSLPVSAAELAQVERALREREREWARQRLVAEQLHRAREAVARQLAAWGPPRRRPRRHPHERRRTVSALTEGLLLVLCLRFVGVPPGQVPAATALAILLVSYPLTALPFAGLGVLDTSAVVAALVVWRVGLLLVPLALGAWRCWLGGAGPARGGRTLATATADGTDRDVAPGVRGWVRGRDRRRGGAALRAHAPSRRGVAFRAHPRRRAVVRGA